MEINKEWLIRKQVITAEDIKKMDPGETVYIHRAFGRLGEHKVIRATVVKKGKRKALQYWDWRGLSACEYPKTAPNIAYTKD